MDIISGKTTVILIIFSIIIAFLKHGGSYILLRSHQQKRIQDFVEYWLLKLEYNNIQKNLRSIFLKSASLHHFISLILCWLTFFVVTTICSIELLIPVKYMLIASTIYYLITKYPEEIKKWIMRFSSDNKRIKDNWDNFYSIGLGTVLLIVLWLGSATYVIYFKDVLSDHTSTFPRIENFSQRELGSILLLSVPYFLAIIYGPIYLFIVVIKLIYFLLLLVNSLFIAFLWRIVEFPSNAFNAIMFLVMLFLTVCTLVWG